MSYALSPRFLLIYTLFFSVIMDIAFGILSFVGLGSFKISLLYRMTLLLLFFQLLLRRKAFDAWLLKGVIVWFFFCLSVWLIKFGKIDIVLDLNYFLRALFPICITFIIWDALEQGKTEGRDYTPLVIKAMMLHGVVASCSLLFSAATGIGRLTYGEWAFGYKSFFTGGNDIGLTLLLIMCVSWAVFWKNVYWTNLARVVLLTAGVLVIGSRASFGGAVAITVVFASLFAVFKHSTNLKIRGFKAAVIVVVCSVGISASLYISDNYDELGYQVQKVTELLEGISPRAKLQDAAWEVLDERENLLNWVGQGTMFFYKLHEVFYLRYPIAMEDESVAYKAVENDLMDIFGLYGVVLGLFLVGYHVFYLRLAMGLFFKVRNIEHFAFVFAITIFIGHGVFAGHAMVTTQVATIIGGIYGLVRFKLEQLKQGVNC